MTHTLHDQQTLDDEFVGIGDPVGKGRWIERWDPENERFWAVKGKAIAKRNLIFSIVAEHIGFSVWLLWSIVIVKMYGTDAAPGAHGWTLSATEGLILLACVSGVGAALRIPYTFAVPIFGGRNWTAISAFLLLVPTLGMAYVVGKPETPFWVLVAIAATAGLGGGNFASSMSNISFFYPDKEKGWALGLNAAGGNIGVAVAQKLVPTVIVVGGGVTLAYAGLVYVPLAILAGGLALIFMDNLGEAKADPKPTARSMQHGHTWVMAFLYIGTFGSFIGYSAAFPSLLTVVFERGDIALAYGFLGALVGSLSRPYGGKLADRFGGSIVTIFAFAAMMAGGILAVVGVNATSLPLFFVSFMLLFVATGIGNGSTYRMIPSIFKRLSATAGSTPEVELDYRRQAAGAVGIISAVGAFGGFFIPLIYAWSKAATGSIVPAMQGYVVVFAIMAALTWWCYLRKSSVMANV